MTPEVQARVRELNPRVTIVNVPDVGHLIRYDNYTAFMDALRAFLKQIPVLMTAAVSAERRWG